MADNNLDSLLWGAATPTKATSNYTSKYFTDTAQSSELDKNTFLNLLVTQMKYQDPTNPLDDKEFLAQMAQFTSLEQMQNMNATLANSRGYSMIGKYAVAQTLNSSTGALETVEGRVEGVVVNGSKTYITIGDKQISIDEVTDVYEDYTELSQFNNINTSLETTQNLALVGKNVQALIMNTDGTVKEFVEGKVDYVKFYNGTTMLVVNGKDVLPGEVMSVSAENLLIGKDVNITSKDESGAEIKTTGAVDAVVINDKKVYLSVGGENIEVESLDYMTESLNLVGKNITYKDVSGTVNGVTISDTKIYLDIGGEEVLYSDYRSTLS